MEPRNLVDPTRSGAALLCMTDCNSAANVVDVVAFSEGEAHPPLPAGISFLPAGLTGVSGTDSYNRVTNVGQTPNFLASDWTIGAASM